MTNFEEQVNLLYDMIQEARGVPLNAEKCMLDREQALDMLDEIRANLPTDLKMAREIVETRNELIASGKREASELRKKAEEYVRKAVSESALVAEAQKQADTIVAEAEQQATQIREAVAAYCASKLNDTEACANAMLDEIKKCRERFEQVNPQ